MTLSEKQQVFSRLVARLIDRIDDAGFACALGECKRSDEQAEINAIGTAARYRVAALIKAEFPQLAEKITNNGKNNGVRNSVHQIKLAIDVDLFKGSAYLSATEDHRPFGEWWEQQHELARWGGRWGDGNHYSLEDRGIK